MMKYSVKTTNIDMTDALREHIDIKIAGLDKYFSNIIMSRLEIGLPSKHHNKGDIFRAEVNIQVPGDVLRVETTNEDMYAAIDSLARKMKNALIKHKERKH